jgi:isopenicillin N synthase-like dioxygenase
MQPSGVKTVDAKIIAFSYKDLVERKANLSSKIEEAYGDKGLGICVVTDVPGFIEARAKLLPLANKLGNLSEKALEKITFPEIEYGQGWSHGKEKFKGKADFSKGSFYANANKEDKIMKRDSINSDLKLNIWPEEIPELKDDFQNLGQLIIDVGIELSYHIDQFCKSQNPNYEDGKLVRVIKESDKNTGRLLHYFPREEKNTEDAWCGLHNDHGSLTGLCGAMYIDKDGKQVDIVDEESGLFIYGRDGHEHRAKIPKNALAFQIGETMQIHSGGKLRATPHYVKIGNALIGTGISRNTLAVFMEPTRSEPLTLPEGSKYEEVIGKEVDGLPKLADRYIDGKTQTFGDFDKATMVAFAM